MRNKVLTLCGLFAIAVLAGCAGASFSAGFQTPTLTVGGSLSSSTNGTTVSGDYSNGKTNVTGSVTIPDK